LEATGRLETSLFHTFEDGNIGHGSVLIRDGPLGIDGALGPRAGPVSEDDGCGGAIAVRACGPTAVARLERTCAPAAGSGVVSGAGMPPWAGSAPYRFESEAPEPSSQLEEAAAARLHARNGSVDVADIEVIQPVWHRLDWPFGEHAADCLPAGGEQLISLGRPRFGVRLLPAEQCAVERKRLFPVGGEQLMPAHAPRIVQRGGRRIIAVILGSPERKLRARFVKILF